MAETLDKSRCPSCRRMTETVDRGVCKDCWAWKGEGEPPPGLPTRPPTRPRRGWPVWLPDWTEFLPWPFDRS